MKRLWYLPFALICLCCCSLEPKNVQTATTALEIYPDYSDVTIPCNLAPLNFVVRGEQVEAVQAQVGTPGCEADITTLSAGNKVMWDEAQWHAAMARHLGDTLQAIVTARVGGQWLQYAPLQWVVSPDSIDHYITYRLIEPGYEVWHEVSIEERDMESFAVRTLADGKQLGNRCMNCHTHGGRQGQYSYMYVRGKDGGAFVQRNGEVQKLALNNALTNGSTVYGDWHPSGRYAVYSTNKIIPAFHSNAHQRLEVYDTRSDLCIADFESAQMITSPLFSQTNRVLETFPCFSADGQYIYYCAAQNPYADSIPSAVELSAFVGQLHYSLMRVRFDASTGTVKGPAETIVAATDSTSISFPKCSHDGSFIAYTVSDYGTFPIWHREARICVQSLTTHHASRTTHHSTYHSWNANSRWLAFASKAYDTQYSRIQLVHVDADGNLSAPLTLPQADPSSDDMSLKSYNIPDMGNTASVMNTELIQQMMKQECVQFK